MKYVLQGELPGVDWLSLQRHIAPGDLIDYKRFLNLYCSLSGFDDKKVGVFDDRTPDAILR